LASEDLKRVLPDERAQKALAGYMMVVDKGSDFRLWTHTSVV